MKRETELESAKETGIPKYACPHCGKAFFEADDHLIDVLAEPVDCPNCETEVGPEEWVLVGHPED